MLRLIVVYNLARFAPWDIFGLRGISTFWHKKSEKKIVKINIYFELKQVFMYTFLCQNVLIFPIFIIHKKN